jgi:hypothetical protein
MVQEANKAVKRQIREVATLNIDVYTLAAAHASALANSLKVRNSRRHLLKRLH